MNPMEKSTSKALAWIGAITAFLTALAAFMPLIMRLLPDASPPPRNSSPDNSLDPANGRSYHLEVINGEGSGRYKPGAVLTIEAAPPRPAMEFTGWSVPEGIDIDDPETPVTTLRMPEHDLSIAARFTRQFHSVSLTPALTEPWRSGTISRNGSVSGPGIGMGDTSDGTSLRAFITFDLDILPPGAGIHQASLVMRHSGTNGDLSRDDIGNFFSHFIVERISTGPSLGPGDYSKAGESAGQYPTQLIKNNWHTKQPVDVTAAVQRALQSGRQSVTFRLRFLAERDNDSQGDAIYLDTRGDRLRLELEYAQ